MTFSSIGVRCSSGALNCLACQSSSLGSCVKGLHTPASFGQSLKCFVALEAPISLCMITIQLFERSSCRIEVTIVNGTSCLVLSFDLGLISETPLVAACEDNRDVIIDCRGGGGGGG